MTHSHTPPLEALLAQRAWVRALARRLADNAVDADDLEQDAWLAAARARPHDGAGIRAWFAKVVRNRAAERRRLDRHRTSREAAVARPESVAAASGADVVVDAETHARVVQAVLSLDEPYRQTVLLRFYEGLSRREVAERMGVQVDTVKTRLRRAAEALRAALGGEREDWLGALAPLLFAPHGAPTPVAVAGGIAMKVSTKAALAALVIALAGGGWFAWKVVTEDATSRGSTATTAGDASSPRSRHGPATAPAPRGGIDGSTTIAGSPAPAHVAAWRIGAPRSSAPPERGRPLWSGIRWSDLPTPAAADAETDADATGAFALSGLGTGAWRVLATFEDGRRAARIVDLTTEAPRARVSLEAPPAGLSLRGRAVHADGRAFSGWIGVRLNGPDPGRNAGQEADETVWCVTGPDGAFAFAGLAPSGTQLLAVDGGRTFVAVTVDLPHEGEYVLVVDRSGPRKSGRVVAAKDGAPLGGVAVHMRTLRGWPVHRSVRTTSGPDGRFEFEWLGPARFDATAEGFATATVQVDDPADEVILRLVRNGAVVGRVLRADDGSPVPGAVVHVRTTDRSSGDEEPTATSGADGAFRVDGVRPGDASVFVLGGGWASRGLAAAHAGGFDPFVVRVAPDTTTTADLVVDAAGRAEGRVITADGAPVGGAAVMAWAMHSYGKPSHTRTAAEGAFAFDDLVPGAETTFTATPTAGPPKRSDPVRAASGKTVQVEIRLDPERRIDVTVLEEGTDARVPSAAISAVPLPRNAYAKVQPEWVADAAGRADIGPLRAGKIGVRAMARGYAPSQDDVIAEEIDPAHLSAVVRLVRAGPPITGRVTAPEGVSVECVDVTARGMVDPAAPSVATRTHGARTLTRADGSFVLDGLPEGVYVVRAGNLYSPGRRFEASLDGVRSGTDVVLALAPPEGTRYVVLRVLDAAGSAVEEALVRSQLEGGGFSTGGYANVREGHALLGVARGAVTGWIAVLRPRSSATSAVPSGAAVVKVDFADPAPEEFEIRLPPERRIAGRVFGPDGSGARGVRVVARPVVDAERAPMGDPFETQVAATTSASGEFELGALGDFRYSLSFDVEPGIVPPTPVQVEAGATGVEVRLASGRETTVKVLDADGKPIAGCYLMLIPGRSAYTSATGEAVFPPLDLTARGFTLYVEPPEDRDDVLPVQGRPWTLAETEIRLERAYAVAGIVRDVQGRPLGGAKVFHAVGANTWWHPRTRTGSDGRFRIGRLRAGETIRLRAVAAGEEDFTWSREPDSVQANAGDAGVVLVVDLSTSVRVRVEGLLKGEQVPFLFSSSSAQGESTAGGAGAGAGSWSRNGTVPVDGVIRLAGLESPARNRVFVGPTADGMYGFTGALVPGAGEVVVRLVRGEPLAGRVVVPAGADLREVSVAASGDGWSASTRPDREGRFRFPGLPPGPCDLRAYVFRDGRMLFQGTARAATNTDAVVELTGGDVPK